VLYVDERIVGEQLARSSACKNTLVVVTSDQDELREFWVLPDLLEQRRDAILLRLAEVGLLSF
jgi:hypothetical protein